MWRAVTCHWASNRLWKNPAAFPRSFWCFCFPEVTQETWNLKTQLWVIWLYISFPCWPPHPFSFNFSVLYTYRERERMPLWLTSLYPCWSRQLVISSKHTEMCSYLRISIHFMCSLYCICSPSEFVNLFLWNLPVIASSCPLLAQKREMSWLKYLSIMYV